MADPLKVTEESKDKLIARLIASDEPLEVPGGLLDSIMEKVEALPVRPAVRAYVPPAWLRWGIPGILTASFLVLVIFGQSTPGKSISLPDLAFAERFLTRLNQWLGGLSKGIQIPDLSLPGYSLWIITGSIALMWGFYFLNRFLERKTGG